MKKKSLIFLTIIIAGFIIMAFKKNYLYEEDIYYEYINKIETSINNGKVALNDEDKIISQTLNKNKNGEKLLVEEEFILGYYYKTIGSLDEADIFIKNVNDKITVRTNTFLKYFNAKMYIEKLIREEKYAEACEAFKNIYNKFTNKEINNNTYISDLAKSILDIPGGRTVVLKVYEDIVYGKKKLNTEKLISYKADLIVLYTLNGSYVKGIEASLENITLCDEEGYKYYQAKSMVDLGILFMTLNDYKTGIDIIEKSLEIEVDNLEKNAKVKCYGLINLLDGYICDNHNNNNISDINEQLKKYYGLLSESDKQNIKFTAMICKAKVKMIDGNYEKAKEILEEVKIYLDNNIEMAIIDLKIYYDIFYGELLVENGQVDQAIEIYEIALNEINHTGNSQYRKIVLKNLVIAYGKTGDIQKRVYYMDEMYNENQAQSITINEDYKKYAISKYAKDKQSIKDNALRFKWDIVIIITILIIIIVLLRIYMRYERLVIINRLDGLTGAFNRSNFDVEYNNLMEKGEKFYLIIFDVDNFKIINDTYGHVFADNVLIDIVKIVKKLLGSFDSVYRYGGEEFVILMKGCDINEALERAEKIRKSIFLKRWRKDVTVTISLGIAENLKGYDDVLEEADRKLYISKKTGKNKITY